MKENEVGMGIAGADLRVRRQAKVFREGKDTTPPIFDLSLLVFVEMAPFLF